MDELSVRFGICNLEEMSFEPKHDEAVEEMSFEPKHDEAVCKPLRQINQSV